MVPNCPACHSENTLKFSIVYTGGVQHKRSRSSYLSYAGHMTAGAARALGVSVSEISERCAPPRAQPAAGQTFLCSIFIALGVVAVLTSTSGIGSFLLLLGAMLGMSAFGSFKFNRDEFPELAQRWQRAYVCLRCDHSFLA